MRKIMFLVLIAAVLLPLGCTRDNLQVESSAELDKLPAFVGLLEPADGIGEKDAVLVLVPTLPTKVRITRAPAEVVAVFDAQNHSWRVPADSQATLSPLNYRFLEVFDIREAGIEIDASMSGQLDLPVNSANASWLRLKKKTDDITVELYCEGATKTVRKATYKPEPEGLAAVLQSGALLTIK